MLIIPNSIYHLVKLRYRRIFNLLVIFMIFLVLIINELFQSFNYYETINAYVDEGKLFSNVIIENNEVIINQKNYLLHLLSNEKNYVIYKIDKYEGDEGEIKVAKELPLYQIIKKNW